MSCVSTFPSVVEEDPVTEVKEWFVEMVEFVLPAQVALKHFPSDCVQLPPLAIKKNGNFSAVWRIQIFCKIRSVDILLFSELVRDGKL